jgi:hypothetical protein
VFRSRCALFTAMCGMRSRTFDRFYKQSVPVDAVSIIGNARLGRGDAAISPAPARPLTAAAAEVDASKRGLISMLLQVHVKIPINEIACVEGSCRVAVLHQSQGDALRNLQVYDHSWRVQPHVTCDPARPHTTDGCSARASYAKRRIRRDTDEQQRG